MNTNRTAAYDTRFEILAVALSLIEHLREPVGRIQAQDNDLARQLRRAASSVPLNLSEGNRRAGKDRTYHFRVAAGSADEVRACLLVALAWGHVDREAIAGALALVDRVLAMAHRLTR